MHPPLFSLFIRRAVRPVLSILAHLEVNTLRLSCYEVDRLTKWTMKTTEKVHIFSYHVASASRAVLSVFTPLPLFAQSFAPLYRQL